MSFLSERRRQYLELLRDPRWQRKRLEIFERDGFICLECGADDKTLHVHHLFYGQGGPWMTPEFALRTLCEECHESASRVTCKEEHGVDQYMWSLLVLGRTLEERGLNSEDLLNFAYEMSLLSPDEILRIREAARQDKVPVTTI